MHSQWDKIASFDIYIHTGRFITLGSSDKRNNSHKKKLRKRRRFFFTSKYIKILS